MKTCSKIATSGIELVLVILYSSGKLHDWFFLRSKLDYKVICCRRPKGGKLAKELPSNGNQSIYH